MGDWGIKVSKSGSGVSSSDLRDLLMHSNYSMFKYHLDTTTSMTINGGDTSKTVTVAHNLGYVPAFLAYFSDGTYNTLLPNRRSYMTGEDEHIYATADSTNIYIKWKSYIPYNYIVYPVSDYWNTYSNDNSYFEIGREGSSGYHGALRFTNVTVTGSESITYAHVKIICDWKLGANTNWMRWENYGIDEDNTGSFGDPMGRTKTTATSHQDRTVPNLIGDDVDIDVLTMFNEIRQRGGWSSGNAMGFMMTENGSDNDSAFASFAGGGGASLQVQKSGSTSYSFRVLVFKDKIA
jgi:hypothetical protein